MAITLADFNKIWASTSPLTPYSFSESNYKQGWNFVGSTPPARQMWDYLQKYAIRQQAKGNGFGYGLVPLDGIARTLSARYYKDGAEILIPQGENQNPRRLTPKECSRLMGYPENFIIDSVSEVQAYRQCGNSVVVPLITDVAKEIVKTIRNGNIRS